MCAGAWPTKTRKSSDQIAAVLDRIGRAGEITANDLRQLEKIYRHGKDDLTSPLRLDFAAIAVSRILASSALPPDNEAGGTGDMLGIQARELLEEIDDRDDVLEVARNLLCRPESFQWLSRLATSMGWPERRPLEQFFSESSGNRDRARLLKRMAVELEAAVESFSTDLHEYGIATPSRVKESTATIKEWADVLNEGYGDRKGRPTLDRFFAAFRNVEGHLVPAAPITATDDAVDDKQRTSHVRTGTDDAPLAARRSKVLAVVGAVLASVICGPVKPDTFARRYSAFCRQPVKQPE